MHAPPLGLFCKKFIGERTSEGICVGAEEMNKN
jgi:hypothetical protein